MEKQKDKWDKLNSISGLVAGILIAIIGGMFTYVYRANELESLAFQHAQEIRISQVKAIQSFMPHLNSSNKKEQEIATKLASLIRSEGAISALSKMAAGSESSSEQAVSSLVKALQDPDWMVRANAAEALVHLGPTAKSAAPALAVLLEDPDSGVRSQAARSLGSLGNSARDYIPMLTELLKDQSAIVRASAAEALGRLNQKDEHNKAN